VLSNPTRCPVRIAIIRRVKMEKDIVSIQASGVACCRDHVVSKREKEESGRLQE
jgi:hypothetical protein